MGLHGKWIESEPGDPIRGVAKRALRARMEPMWRFLKLAVREPRDEVENVHQLRVYSRRAAAVMEIFADWLPPRRAERMQKHIKRIRKAAGDARDLDVLAARAGSRVARLSDNEAVLLAREFEKRRQEAQRPIEQVYEALKGKRFRRKCRSFIKRVRCRRDQADCDRQFACLARAELGRLVVPYLESAAAELTDPQALHAFRIQGKQVRYAMEVFAGAFDSSFRHDLYPLVATLQDRLGEINDYVTSEKHLALWREQADSDALAAALDSLRRLEHESLASARQAFLVWWTPERRAELRRGFARYVPSESAPQVPPATDLAG